MTNEIVTGDDSATCGLCGHETSLAMLTVHLERAHGIDPAEIASAPIVDYTDPRDDELGGPQAA